MNIVLNKVFTGKYLENNLGHELKNFLVCDDNTRGIYITPKGRCSIKPDYVIHLIHSNDNRQKQVYEIVGISKVSKKNISDDQYLNKTFMNKPISEIFSPGTTNNITFLCDQFYILKENKSVYIKMGANEPKIVNNSNNEIFINITRRFGQSEAMHTICKPNDLKIINTIFDKLNDFFEIKNHNLIDYSQLKSELPFCIINDRVSLECSMSNMIAYFLRRDKMLLNKFINDFLNIKTSKNEVFEIVREEKNIDLILKNIDKVIVIENKINSSINGIQSKNYSQLSKYYDYVNHKYKEHNKYFFILKPNSNYISNEYINNFKHGDKYIIKNYSDLYNILKNHEFNYIDEYGKFIFDEFKINILYLTWTKAKQVQYSSFITLKQIINT